MDIQQEQQGDYGSFFIISNGERAGELRYFATSPTTINIYHTEVIEELRGQNAGKQLVEAAVNYAREKKLKIIPSCSYAKVVFEREKEYQDVLA